MIKRDISPDTWDSYGIHQDKIGPERIVGFYDDKDPEKLKGLLVIDNTTNGPGIGGVRMAENVTFHELFWLARRMTGKNTAAALTHGGVKSALLVNPSDYPIGSDQRHELMEEFALALKNEEDYIAGPDMGTNEQDMQVIYSITGRAIGRPKANGGIPLDELGFTAYGVDQALEVIVNGGYVPGLQFENARVILEGYGNVANPLSRLLYDRGCKIAAVSDLVDSRTGYGGIIVNYDGINIPFLQEIMEVSGTSVVAYPPTDGTMILNHSRYLPLLFAMTSDVLIPAARAESINANNKDYISTKLIVQAANEPVDKESELDLHNRGILSGPDSIMNAGGVISGAYEYKELQEGLVDLPFEERVQRCKDLIRSTIRDNTKYVFDRARETGLSHRDVTSAMIRERLNVENEY